MNRNEIEQLVETCGKTFFVVNFHNFERVFNLHEGRIQDEMDYTENFYGALSYGVKSTSLRLNAAKKIFAAKAEIDALDICNRASELHLDANQLRISGDEIMTNAGVLLAKLDEDWPPPVPVGG